MSLTGNRLKGSLAAITLLVWAGVFIQLWRANQLSGDDGGNMLAMPGSTGGLNMDLLKTPAISLDTSIRDPFSSFLYAAAPKPVVVAASAKPKALQKIVSPPTASLSGFMGGKEPIAILKNGEETELLKAGDSAWGFTVKKISKSLVIVIKEGKEFEIRP